MMLRRAWRDKETWGARLQVSQAEGPDTLPLPKGNKAGEGMAASRAILLRNFP